MWSNQRDTVYGKIYSLPERNNVPRDLSYNYKVPQLSNNPLYYAYW